jgi:hypothetical protein
LTDSAGLAVCCGDWLSAVVAYVNTAGGKAWWETGQFGYIPEVRNRVNEVIENGTDYDYQQIVEQTLSQESS